MHSQTLQTFLAHAHREAGTVRQIDDFSALCGVAQGWGLPLNESDLRNAFEARQARRLSESMLAAGLLDRESLPEPPVWDAAAWNRVAALDFKAVSAQVMDRKQWTPERTQRAEIHYRRFLYMIAAELPVKLVPSEDIDEF